MVKTIFNKIQGLNPKKSIISSMGEFISPVEQQISDIMVQEIIELLPEGSLALKIAKNATFFTEKQLWVIAFELAKNETYTAELVLEVEDAQRRAQFKKEEAEMKKSENKEKSAPALKMIKDAKKKLSDYYDFLKSNKSFLKEFYSKKYSETSAKAFLEI
jgi:hypothetical protein